MLAFYSCVVKGFNLVVNNSVGWIVVGATYEVQILRMTAVFLNYSSREAVIQAT